MKKIGIIGAMDIEVAELISMLENKCERIIAGLSFNEGIIEGKNVVVVQSGISKVNAAMCTQILISEFGVDALVNTGVAGAVHEDLNVLDVVISTDAIEYDVDASAFGHYERGMIPGMENSIFMADEYLIDAAYESFKNINPESNVMKGRVVTGDRFVASKEAKHDLRATFSGYCCEMEGAAIAHVATLNKVPFVIIRAISDKADGEANMSFDKFVEIAARNSKNMVVNMLFNIK